MTIQEAIGMQESIKRFHRYDEEVESSCDKRERLELQTKAITYCDEMLFYIELSMKLNIINTKSMEYWSKMVKDIKHMTIAWRKKDRGR